MAQEIKKKLTKQQVLGLFYFLVFLILIIGGIIHKRVYGHPEFMMMWHLPAAIFLILAGKKMTSESRKRFYQRSKKNP